MAQRRADALVDIAAAFLAAKGAGGRVPVGLDVTIDYGPLAGEPVMRRVMMNMGAVDQGDEDIHVEQEGPAHAPSSRRALMIWRVTGGAPSRPGNR